MTQKQSEGPLPGPYPCGPEGGALSHQRSWGPAWRTARPFRAVLVGGVGAASLAALVWTAAAGFHQPYVALAFCLVIAGGELARITLPGHRESAPIALAGAIAYAFLLSLGGEASHHTAWQVVAVVALGVALGELPHVAVGRGPRLEDVARRVLTASLLAVAFRPLVEALALTGPSVVVALMMTVLVALAWSLDVAVSAVLRAERLRTRLVVAMRDEARAQVATGGAIASSGVLIALACTVTGLVGLLVFLAPLLVSQVAFRRHAEVRRTYLETVRALSRVTEVGGYVENGHSRRVSQLSHGIACELGLAEAELLELEYAALMHDIGQLSLREPIAGGATLLSSPREQRRIAELGSAIIRETGVLDNVAEMVRRQCEPLAGDGDEGVPPLGSRIIKVANAFDDLVGENGDAERRAAVVERLRMDTGSEYDPRVVDALSNVLARG
ncbi:MULTISPECIES: HD domain-containing phosphohydrolase [unclassified Nocardiopsis]|uniref:HD domain-containing phosphohydrolase n=1 Tax=unclassified Nocardiopsis TaxID=2649073 RepID=UPI00066ED734|nr:MULTISPECIES: HD domain-containing phosphohydrolase [unclassified Nocardiopsis]MBQ1083676.1 HD domain-containing protein [Nocardiopsis sp. B62]